MGAQPRGVIKTQTNTENNLLLVFIAVATATKYGIMLHPFGKRMYVCEHMCESVLVIVYLHLTQPHYKGAKQSQNFGRIFFLL